MNGIVSALLMVITFALSFIFVRKIEQIYSTVFINFIRALIGLGCFALYTLVIRRFHLITALNLRLWGILGLSIIFSVVIGDTAFFQCQKRIGPPNAATFAITSPIFTMILSILILGKSFQWVLLLSSLITGTGVYLLVKLQENAEIKRDSSSIEIETQAKLDKKTLIAGSFFGMIASLAWSFATVYAEMGMAQSEEILQIGADITMVTNIIRYIIATTCMGGWWMIEFSHQHRKSLPFSQQKIQPEPHPIDLVDPQPEHETPNQPNAPLPSHKRGFLILLLSAILGTFLGEVFFGIAIVQVGSTFIAIMGSALPVFTIPLNYLVNREKIILTSLPGILITLAGVILLIIGTA